MSTTPSAFADAREQFLAMVASVRPELHRYCARLTGSVIEGEDVVQDHDHLLGPQRAHVRAQRAAAQVLHRDVRRAVGDERLVDHDDVRVRQRAGDVRLAQEALDQRRVLGAERGQLLERDQTLEVGLAREKDGRHAAASELAQDLVAADRETTHCIRAHRGRP